MERASTPRGLRAGWRVKGVRMVDVVCIGGAMLAMVVLALYLGRELREELHP